MRSFSLLVFAVILGTLTPSCTPEPMEETPEVIPQKVVPPETSSEGEGKEVVNENQEQSMTIRIIIGSKEFKADIENTETGKAFIAKLPLTLEMTELNGNEKYCYGVSLPRADKPYESISAGDLMLFSGNCVVLFYGPAGGYSYTRIGRLLSTEGLKDALGTGDVRVTFSN